MQPTKTPTEGGKKIRWAPPLNWELTYGTDISGLNQLNPTEEEYPDTDTDAEMQEADATKRSATTA